MRILVVNKFFWPKGGSERVMLDLNRGFEAAGHEVVHFAMASNRDLPSPYAAHFVPEIRYEDLRSPVSFVRAAARAIWSREAATCLRRLVRETRPDVAHLHNFHHQLSPSVVDVLRDEGVGACHTLHDYKVICPNYLLHTQGRVCERCRSGRFHHAVVHRCLRGSLGPSVVAFAEMTYHRLARTLERGVRRFVSPSRFLADKLVQFGVAPERIRHVPNGVRAEDFEPANGTGEGFLYGGRLSPEKGVLTLLRAVSRTDGVQLTVTGDGPQRAALEKEAAEIAPGRVTFTGRVSREELLARMRSSRAVVLPSEWYENAPIAALEALAAGVPMVASRIGGNPEIVRDEETGLLFPPGDSAALGEKLARLERDAALARRLGDSGRTLVEREFRLDDQIERTLSVLEEVAASASR